METILELRDAWILYCEAKFPDADEFPPPEPFSPRQTAMLLFENSFLFTARYDAIRAAPYDTMFDEEADGSLIVSGKGAPWVNGVSGLG